MNKFFFIAIVMLSSCNNQNAKLIHNISKDDSISLNNESDHGNNISYIDSISVSNGQLIFLEKSLKSEFEGLEKKSFFDLIEIQKTLKSELILETYKGKKIILKDTLQNTDSGDQVSYDYIGFNKKNNSYLIREKFYESGDYLLISKVSGEVTKLWSIPIFSEDGKRFITCSPFLAYNVMPNGIQAWQTESNGKCHLIWEYETPKWEPTDACWIDNSTVCMKRTIPSFKSRSNKDEVDYVRFKVSK